ncbi:MAG: universal stress protein [Nitrospirae bacterium]|nr:universal stress protein [Nitrospirota bacterium]
MARYRKILVAVDGSESGKNAFRQACRIARQDKCWVTALTTVPIFSDQFDVLSIREKVSATLKAEGDRILDDIRAVAQEEDVFISTLLMEGTPFDTIVDTADDGNFDLVVMGRHGRHRIEKALVGSVTARVIGSSKRNVLVVPAGSRIGWETILLATDGSKHSGTATRKAIDLAESYHGRLLALSVVDVTEEFQTEAPEAVDKMVTDSLAFVETVKKNADSRGIATEALVREGETFEVITDLAGKYGSNVIVMGSHGRTGFGRLLMGSVTEKVIGYAPCPVLVVSAQQ